jgi:hypothetical protein
VNNVRYEATRIFRNKKRNYFREKINELEINVRTKISNLHRAINEFKNC